MEFGIIDALRLVGSLGLFIFGMKLMSDGIQKVSGDGLRKLLKLTTKNKYLGIITGFIITLIIQSSSATTVMTVSFVNAGLLTLIESAGVMLGANIGTTVTGWLVVLLGFKVKIASFSLPLLAIGTPLLFFRKERLKFIGESIIGFAFLFWGLDELKNSVPDIKGNPELLYFLNNYAQMGLLSNLMFVLIGALLTIIVQSSSASITLTITLCAKGIIPFEVAGAMVLGENIGTTITAEIASFVGNVYAKRSARIHSLFNLIGVSWMVLLISFTPFLEGLRSIINSILHENNVLFSQDLVGIAVFHTVFNFLNVVIIMNFIPFLVRLSERTIKSKGREDEIFHLERIAISTVNTSELSLMEVNKELSNFGNIVYKMNAITKQLLLEQDDKKLRGIYKKIERYEEVTDKIELEIANYSVKLSRVEISTVSSISIQRILHIARYLERIGDVYYQVSRVMQRKKKLDVYFIPEQRNNLLEMFELIEKVQVSVNEILDSEITDELDKRCNELEEKINKKRKELQKETIKAIEEKRYTVSSGILYSDLINSLERIGDMLYSITGLFKK